MISILLKLKEAIDSSRTDEHIDINERIENDQGRLFLKTKMSQEALNKWQMVYEENKDWLSFSFTDSDYDEIQPKEGISDHIHIVKISFPTFKKSAYILTTEGWRVFLNDDMLIQRTERAYLLFCGVSFDTVSMEVIPWVDEPKEQLLSDIKKTSKVHSHVKKFTFDKVLPSSVEPWVLSGQVVENEVSFNIWMEISIAYLSLVIVNEIYVDANGALSICLSGKPPKTLKFIKSELNKEVFLILQETVSWIYLQGEEVEIKHTFLSNELAREWPPGITYSNGILVRLPLALQSARLLYKAHIRSSSKETIKTLSELRKSLTDDVQKIVNQTKEISTSLWKDVALSLGTVILKHSTDAVKFRSLHNIYSYIFYILAAYLLISFCIPLVTNHRFNKISEVNRKVWRLKLYAFLDDADYNSLAEKPVKKAIETYNLISTIGFVIIFITSLGLIIMGISENHDIYKYINNYINVFPLSFRSNNSFW